jgi:hypothetical protein
MTKEEAISIAINRIMMGDAVNDVGDFLSKEMDKYAIRERIEVIEWVRKQPISIFDSTSQQIDNQFIEQQNKGNESNTSRPM